MLPALLRCVTSPICWLLPPMERFAGHPEICFCKECPARQAGAFHAENGTNAGSATRIIAFKPRLSLTAPWRLHSPNLRPIAIRGAARIRQNIFA